MISVIVPVYNTEKYLKSCLDSVVHSTYQNFEVILIDDGSTDRSLKICRRYCRRDRRIKLLTQKNRGVSAARNRGIDKSRGEWIVFVDSDDCISRSFLEIVARREFQDADMLIFDFCQMKKGLKRKKSADSGREAFYFDAEDTVQIIKKMLCSEKLTEGSRESLFSPCGKAYRRSVIEKYSIGFPSDIIIGEDKIFNLKYHLRAEKRIYISEAVYFVRWRPDSATHCFQRDFVRNYFIFQERLKDLLKEYGIFEILERAYYENVLTAITEVLIDGIFNPFSTRTYGENCRLCHMVREDKIYRSAAKYSVNTGNIPRRVLLYFFNLEYFGVVNLICRLSYIILRLMK